MADVSEIIIPILLQCKLEKCQKLDDSHKNENSKFKNIFYNLKLTLKN